MEREYDQHARDSAPEKCSSGLARVRQIATAQPKLRFTALMHHLTTDLLRQSYFWLKRHAAPGVDGVTWEAYGGEQLDEKIATSMRALIAALCGNMKWTKASTLEVGISQP